MISQRNHEVSLYTPRRDRKAQIYKELDLDDDISDHNLLQPNYYMQETIHKNTFKNFSPWNSKKVSLSETPNIKNFDPYQKKLRTSIQQKNSISNVKGPQKKLSHIRQFSPRTSPNNQKNQPLKIQNINLRLTKPHMIQTNIINQNLQRSNLGEFKRISQDNFNQILHKHPSSPKTSVYYVVQPRYILKHQRFELIQLRQTNLQKLPTEKNFTFQDQYKALTSESPGPGYTIQTTNNCSPKNQRSKRYSGSVDRSKNEKIEIHLNTKQIFLSDKSSLQINQVSPQVKQRKSAKLNSNTLTSKAQQTITQNLKKTVEFAILDQDFDIVKTQEPIKIQDSSIDSLKLKVKRRFLKKNINRLLHFNARGAIITNNNNDEFVTQ